MLARLREFFSVPALLVGALLCSGDVMAQGAADCSKPLPDVPTEWMNTSYLSETNPGGFKSVNTVTVEGDKITMRASFSAIWVLYSFNGKDIKSITKGDYDDGLFSIDIDVAPFQFSNSRGETSAPAGLTQVKVAFPEEVADQAIAGLTRLHQKAVCGK